MDWPMKKNETTYRSFLLRLWTDTHNETMRFRLECILDRDEPPRYFADIDELYDYILTLSAENQSITKP